MYALNTLLSRAGYPPVDEATLEWAIGLMKFKSQEEMEGYITTTFYVDIEQHATQEERDAVWEFLSKKQEQQEKRDGRGGVSSS